MAASSPSARARRAPARPARSSSAWRSAHPETARAARRQRRRRHRRGQTARRPRARVCPHVSRPRISRVLRDLRRVGRRQATRGAGVRPKTALSAVRQPVTCLPMTRILHASRQDEARRIAGPHVDILQPAATRPCNPPGQILAISRGWAIASTPASRKPRCSKRRRTRRRCSSMDRANAASRCSRAWSARRLGRNGAAEAAVMTSQLRETRTQGVHVTVRPLRRRRKRAHLDDGTTATFTALPSPPRFAADGSWDELPQLAGEGLIKRSLRHARPASATSSSSAPRAPRGAWALSASR